MDIQFTLLAIAAGWTVWVWRFDHDGQQIAILVALNLAVNVIFMTHPIFTPYYVILTDMLSLWTLVMTLDLRASGRRITRHSCNRPKPDYGINDPWTDLIGGLKMTTPALRVAVLVLRYEEAAVATVVADFRKALPAAEIFVYDNNSKRPQTSGRQAMVRMSMTCCR